MFIVSRKLSSLEYNEKKFPSNHSGTYHSLCIFTRYVSHKGLNKFNFVPKVSTVLKKVIIKNSCEALTWMVLRFSDYPLVYTRTCARCGVMKFQRAEFVNGINFPQAPYFSLFRCCYMYGNNKHPNARISRNKADWMRKGAFAKFH